MNNKLLSYLEKARNNFMTENHFTTLSDREFSTALGLNPSAINQWRKRNVLPNDLTMIKIAILAGVPVEIALLELNAWRSKDLAQVVYKNILKKLTGAVTTAIMLFILLAPLGNKAFAQEKNTAHYVNTQYILSLF